MSHVPWWCSQRQRAKAKENIEAPTQQPKCKARCVCVPHRCKDIPILYCHHLGRGVEVERIRDLLLPHHHFHATLGEAWRGRCGDEMMREYIHECLLTATRKA